MSQPRSWNNLVAFGLALSGLLVNLVLHLVTFHELSLPTSLDWLKVVYPFIVAGPIVISSLFRHIRYTRLMRYLTAPLPSDPSPPRRALVWVYWDEFRAAPPFARVIYGLGAFLFHYQVLVFLQMGARFGTLNQDVHLWTAMGMFNYLLVTVSAAGSLGWWGWWQARR